MGCVSRRMFRVEEAQLGMQPLTASRCLEMEEGHEEEEAQDGLLAGDRQERRWNPWVFGACLLAVTTFILVLGDILRRDGLTSKAPATTKHASATSAGWAISRDLLPDDHQKEELIKRAFSDPAFMWGCATSAYQVEGAWNKDGRKPSIWDKFTHDGRAFKGSSGDDACDYYHRYEEDLARISEYGFNTYRFSISWTRVFPLDEDGNMYMNEKGVQFYKNVLRILADRGITPIVTMFHWDLPAELDWLDEEVVDYFLRYAEFLLATFPEVNWWSTFNEPWTFCTMGYALGLHAPGKQSQYLQYSCGHNVLRAHARAVDLFRRKFFRPGMKIGLVLNYDFPFPKDPENPHDLDAVQVDAIKGVGWFADPIYKGDYPELLKEIIGEHLPRFTTEEKNLLLKASNHEYNYYGLNTYSGRYVEAVHNHSWSPKQSFWKDDEPIGFPFIHAWLYKVPQEILLHLRWVNDRYHPPGIIITENGCADPGNTEYEYTVDDWHRVGFFRDYLAKVAEAVFEGIPVVGYTAWALIDNFEWADGYQRRFGITYNDFGRQKRTPKKSAKWFQKLLTSI